MIEGICRLCGEDTLLSYEHVPPRVAFNKNTKFVSVGFDDFIKLKDPLKNKPKGKPRQGGIGYNAFCKNCNNYLGANYVPAYKDWVNAGMELLSWEHEHGLNGYVLNEIEPFTVLKQILSMFIAINGEWFLEAYPDLISFVASKDNKELPDRFRVFMYLTRGEKLRYMHYSAHGNLSTGIVTQCSEIAFPPYGYVLTFDFDGNLNFLNEITSFKKFPLGSKNSLKMLTYQLPTYMPFPLDYRSESQIESDIDKSKESLNKNEEE